VASHYEPFICEICKGDPEKHGLICPFIYCTKGGGDVSDKPDKTCGVCCERGEWTEIDLYLTSFVPISDWQQINGIDVCPRCAWIVQRASDLGVLADIVAHGGVLEAGNDDQKPSQG